MPEPTKAEIEQLFELHNSSERRQELLLRSYGFDTTRSWVDDNGYRLSDRIWRARRAVRDQIDRVLREAIANGTDALEVADILEEYLNPEMAPVRNTLGRLIRNQRKSIVTRAPGRGGMGSFPARRLARTEITRAHGAATIETAKRTPFAVGVKWSTSTSHPKADPCDEHARRNAYNLGPGVYPPDRVPRYPEHPQCLCTLSTATESDVDDVVRRLREQYELGDVEAPPTNQTPVSQAFTLPDPPRGLAAQTIQTRGDVNVHAVSQEVLRIIDSVHRDGQLPPISVVADYNQFSPQSARFSFNPDKPTAVELGVNSFNKFSRTARESIVHEIGHFLDHSGIGTPGEFASYNDPLFREWGAALSNSRAAMSLAQDYANGVKQITLSDGRVVDYAVDTKYIEYLGDASEMWARSYSQYIAIRSGDPELLRILDETRRSDIYAAQWEDDDFEPIAAAIDDIFRRLGWIP